MADKKHIQQLQKEFDKFNNAPKYSLDSEEVFCICRKPDNGELMVACDGCDEWFHFKCMGINKNYKNLVNNYYCKFCDELFHKGKSIWKRKCKLTNCFNPIEGESQFCSLEHGNKYWLQFLNKFDISNISNISLNSTEIINKSQVENLIQSIDSKNELLEIGNNLPVFDKNELFVTAEQQSEINNNIDSIKILGKEIEILNLRLNYLFKLKNIINYFNEFLSNSIDSSSNIDNNENLEISKRKKNNKNNKKSKKFKIDICGFDKKLLLDNKPWFEFTNSIQFNNIIDFDKISDNDKSSYKEIYEKLKNNESIENLNSQLISNSNNILLNLCISEKRKCHLHNGWYNIIKDNLELKINENLTEIDKKSKDNEELQQFIQIKNWKIYCNEL